MNDRSYKTLFFFGGGGRAPYQQQQTCYSPQVARGIYEFMGTLPLTLSHLREAVVKAEFALSGFWSEVPLKIADFGSVLV